jgi:hypothetical protein
VKFLSVLVVSVLAAGAAPPAGAQIPGSDIYLVKVGADSLGNLQLGVPQNVIQRPGYDNQPLFTPDGTAFLYTSIRDDQADIYRFDLETLQSKRVTRTAESEFSPTPIPGRDTFSVVQVEADSTQRLWEFSADGKGSTLLLAGIQPVGYHAWADENTVALFILGEPHRLALADIRSGVETPIAEDIGRSLQKIPGRAAVSFLDHEGESWTLKEVTAATHRVRTIAPAPPGAQDHVWLADGSILMTQGPSVLRWDPAAKSPEWETVVTFDYQLEGLGRIAVSPDGKWLALVVAELEP